jgi:hypothetical protein
MKRTPMQRTAFKRAEPKPPSGPKPRKCKNRACRASFVPPQPFVEFCSPDCGAVLALERLAKQKAAKAKAERATDKAKREGMKPLSYYLKKAERACNAYIRARDMGQGCISCGRHDADVWNAGHFVAVGANSTLRYDEDNIHLQCARPCNMDKGGNLIEYRKALLKKIGAERVARLEGWHAPIKRTKEDVLAIESHYKVKLAVIKKLST